MQASNLVRIALRIRSQAWSPQYSFNKAIDARMSPVVRSAAFSSWLDKIADGTYGESREAIYFWIDREQLLFDTGSIHSWTILQTRQNFFSHNSIICFVFFTIAFYRFKMQNCGMQPTTITFSTYFLSRLLAGSTASADTGSSTTKSASEEVKVERVSACGDIDSDDEDEMEQEEMFVKAYEGFGHEKAEWGGPRRGGRLPEPTRFGDWERKGRCSDFWAKEWIEHERNTLNNYSENRITKCGHFVVSIVLSCCCGIETKRFEVLHKLVPLQLNRVRCSKSRNVCVNRILTRWFVVA